MGKIHPHIDLSCRNFIGKQRMFFVATAPNAADGHVNLSPKGLDTFVVLDDHTAAYLDYVGSGVETIAHLRENGRIVVMFCAFEGPPKIVRLHGRGDVLEPRDPQFGMLRTNFHATAAVRSIIRVAVERVSDSCGYGVPLYAYQGERSQLSDWADRKGEAGAESYQRANNRESIDGLPGLRWTDE